jgi:hypothetical protein
MEEFGDPAEGGPFRYLHESGEMQVATASWLVPNAVEIDGDGRGIAWGPTAGMHPAARQAGLLARFTRLADAPADEIREFAETWGVLCHCSARSCRGVHPLLRWGRPTFSADHPAKHPQKARGPLLEPTYHESLLDWHETARRLLAMWRIGAALHAERVADEGDWALVKRGWRSRPRSPAAELARSLPNMGRLNPTVEEQRLLFAWQLDAWLTSSHIGPRAVWDQGRLVFQLGVGGLTDALVLQLALAASGVASFVLCESCGRRQASRRPASDGRRLCSPCASAARQQRYRSNHPDLGQIRRARAVAPEGQR